MKRILSGLLACLLLLGSTTGLFAAPVDFTAARDALQKHIFTPDFEALVTEELAESDGQRLDYAVFVSLGQAGDRAAVVNGTGSTLEKAFARAMDNAGAIPEAKNATGVRVDIVNTVQEVNISQLRKQLVDTKPGRFRMGISLDDTFRTAFLEGELNSNRILNHEGSAINRKQMDNYLKSCGRSAYGKLPTVVLTFTSRGFYYEGGRCYTLASTQDAAEGLRSRPAKPTEATVKRVIDTNARYLLDQIQRDGSYIYCRYADTGATPDDYNILRHAGTTWELSRYAGNSGDESFKSKLEQTIRYLQKSIVYKDDNTAFLVEPGTEEIKLGGNGLALLALIEYEKAFGDGKYKKLCEQLGNGILYMLDAQTGKFNHVFYYGNSSHADFTVKDAFRVTFYDGEAAYALCLLHGLDGQQKWLKAAEKVVTGFLQDGAEQHTDQWVAYTINEITKYKPKEEYYAFAATILYNNLPSIQRRTTASFPNMEQLMCYYEMYERMQEQNSASLQLIDADALVETIYIRADYMLNACLAPEVAMYMADPAAVEGVVAIREDFFRIRIDDVQHFLGGYQPFLREMDSLAQAA